MLQCHECYGQDLILHQMEVLQDVLFKLYDVR